MLWIGFLAWGLAIADSEWFAKVLYSPQHIHDTLNIKVDRDLKVPMHCRNIFYHASSDADMYSSQSANRLLMRKIEFFRTTQPQDCFLYLTPRNDLKSYGKEEKPAPDGFRYRFDAGLQLMDLVNKGRIISDDINSWIVYLEADTIFTYQNFTLSDFLSLIEESLKQKSSEEFICKEKDGVPCPKSRKASLDSVEVVLPISARGHPMKTLLTDSILMFRATSLSGFLFESALEVIHTKEWKKDSARRHKGVPRMAEEALIRVLKEAFDLPPETVAKLQERGNATSNTELFAKRRLDSSAAENHSLFGRVVEKYKPSTSAVIALPPEEWIVGRMCQSASETSWVCGHGIGTLGQCSDMVVYDHHAWRKHAKSCWQSLPFTFGDGGEVPFDASKWLGAGVPEHSDGVSVKKIQFADYYALSAATTALSLSSVSLLFAIGYVS
eukprot:Gregarina_sp_Poly_1__4147@NODE_226_length_11195_cov_150_303648_g200_i0_p4_GENE_NODE_226_length_11195_cov_150_303648_g200_i0NODE_226_length_11195_cov_150_303648_g200_i0_p4_ORF_typecomplete_len440_score60_13Glyco_transf_34/PF05637_12/0_015_NODE_226_length_11195_cov_150_303648_g200_i012562575